MVVAVVGEEFAGRTLSDRGKGGDAQLINGQRRWVRGSTVDVYENGTVNEERGESGDGSVGFAPLFLSDKIYIHLTVFGENTED